MFFQIGTSLYETPIHYYITYARVEQITKRYSQREGKKRSTLKETN